MNKKCKLDAHNRLLSDNWRLLRFVFSNLSRFVQKQNDKGHFWLFQTFELQNIPEKGRYRQGFKKCFEGFFNRNSSCECNACSKRRRHAAPISLDCSEKVTTGLFRPNCIESMAMEGLTAPISPSCSEKMASGPFFKPNCIESTARSHIGRRNPSGSSS